MKTKTTILLMIGLIFLLSACGAPAAEELPVADELQAILDNTLAQYDAGKGISAAVIVPGYQTWVGVSGIMLNMHDGPMMVINNLLTPVIDELDNN